MFRRRRCDETGPSHCRRHCRASLSARRGRLGALAEHGAHPDCAGELLRLQDRADVRHGSGMVLPGGNGRMERRNRPHSPPLRPHPLSGHGHVGQREAEGGNRRASVARHPALRSSGFPAGLPVRHAVARTARDRRRIFRQRQPGELPAALALPPLRDRREAALRPETGTAPHPARRRLVPHRAGGALPIKGGVFRLLPQGGEIPARRSHSRTGDSRRRRRGAR